MSEKVPWNDPGGAPCCCITNCTEPAANAAYRDIELTLEEYAAIYANGTLVTEITGSADLVYNPAISASMSGSGSVSYQITHTLKAVSPISGFRGPFCDKSTDSVITQYNPNCTSSITATGTEQTVSCRWARGESITLKPYNNGQNFAYGLQISVSNIHQFIVQGRYRNNFGFVVNMNPVVSIPTSMSAANDNAFFDLILPTRTVAIPYRRGFATSASPSWGGSITATAEIATHEMTYAPSAP